MKEIFIKSNYIDDQIKKFVDERLNKNKFKDFEGNKNNERTWKNYDNYKHASPGAYASKDHNQFKNNYYNNNNKFERHAQKIFQKEYYRDSTTLNSDSYSKNLSNYNNSQGSVYTKKRNNFVTSYNDNHYSSNFNSSFRSYDEVSFRTGHETVQDKDMKSTIQIKKNALENVENQICVTTHNLNINKIQDNDENHLKSKSDKINENINNMSQQETEIRNIEVIEKLGLPEHSQKKESSKMLEMNNKVAECELVSLKRGSAINLNIDYAKFQDSEIQDGVNKIKENPKKNEENSKINENETKITSSNDDNLECSSATKDKDIMEIRNMSLTIGPCETKEHDKNLSPNETDSCSYDLPFDMTKIPNNLLNAKNYGEYFFNHNSGRDGSNTRQHNQNNVFCFINVLFIGFKCK